MPTPINVLQDQFHGKDNQERQVNLRKNVRDLVVVRDKVKGGNAQQEGIQDNEHNNARLHS